jgi:hypothetical protein
MPTLLPFTHLNSLIFIQSGFLAIYPHPAHRSAQVVLLRLSFTSPYHVSADPSKLTNSPEELLRVALSIYTQSKGRKVSKAVIRPL